MSYSTNGSRPYVGILWWQYLDNWGEKNDWGWSHSPIMLTTDAKRLPAPEALAGGRFPALLQSNRICWRQERDYGNLIESVTGAHQFVLQGVQK
jgi:hypothetical protein